MSKTEILAMPSLCDSTDWDLDWELGNRKMLDMLRRYGKAVVVKDLGKGLIFYHNATFMANGGAYFVLDTTTDTIVYFMEYAVNAATSTIGPTVTQTKVWRSLIAGLPRGFVSWVVFRVLLKRHAAVLSDKLHTEAGKRLWLDLMGFAFREHEYHVILLDAVAKKNFPLTDMAQLSRWARASKGAWSWNSKRHEGIRFLITKKELDEQD